MSIDTLMPLPEATGLSAEALAVVLTIEAPDEVVDVEESVWLEAVRMLSARLGRCTTPLIGPAMDCRVPGMLIMSESASSEFSSNTTEKGRGGSVRILSAVLPRLFEGL